MATVTKPIALDESFNTTEVTPRNIADVLAEGLSHITGRTASEVEYDNTDSGLTADNVQDAIDEVNGKVPTLPSVDIQTAVDEFETYNGGLLSSLKVALSPNQDLHGYSEPWVGGSRKNKAPLKSKSGSGLTFVADELLGKMTLTGTATASGWGTGIITEINLPVGSYVCSATNNPNNANIMTDWQPLGAITSSGITFNVTSNTQPVRVTWMITNGTTYDNVIEGLMIRSASETDPTFEPYENICPISGHTQVEVENHQKNLFNPSNVIIGYIGQSDGEYKIIAFADARTIYARCEPNTTYTISKTAGKRFSVGWSDTLPDIGVIVNDSVYEATASVVTFTTGATAKYIVAFVWLGTQDTITADEMLASCQIELGSTATAYEPYNGYQITVNLGGTYYSGTLDVVSGVFVPDTAIATVSDFAFTAGKSDGDLAKVEYTPSNFKNSIEKLKCNMMPYVEQSASWSETEPCYTIASGTKLRVYFDGDTLADFQADYADIQIIYELATPQSIQLSPTMVKALVGENHLSAPLEGQEITESKYKQMFTFDDVIAYIQSLS